MPVHKVTGKDSSKAGKPRVYFDGKSGWDEAVYVSDKCNVPDVGMTIDAVTASNEYRGKIYWYLNNWKPVAGSQAAPAATPSQDRGNGQSAPTQAPAKGWDIQSGDLSRFVSNIIGSCIAVGLIKVPEDIMRWTIAGYEAGQSLRTASFKLRDDYDPQEGHQDRDPDEDYREYSDTPHRDVPF